jgi:hypothetical protein
VWQVGLLRCHCLCSQAAGPALPLCGLYLAGSPEDQPGLPGCQRHDKYTLLLAVSNSQVVGWRLLQGSANSASFSAFVTDLEVASHHRHVLMDNVAFHKSKVVAAALAAKGLTAMFTPPYSPEYNPVEMAFSVFKAHMRPMLPGADTATVADRLADMQVRVRGCAATALTQHKLAAMFRHVWRSMTPQGM